MRIEIYRLNACRERPLTRILLDTSTAAMVEAIEANLLAYFPEFRHLPNAEVHLGPDIFWALTDVPYPLYNSILRCPDRVRQDRCGNRKRPVIW